MRTAKIGPGLRLLARRLLGLLIIFPNEDRNIWLEVVYWPSDVQGGRGKGVIATPSDVF